MVAPCDPLEVLRQVKLAPEAQALDSLARGLAEDGSVNAYGSRGRIRMMELVLLRPLSVLTR
jgi:hypothetical protein